jgi:two-component system chemotaxis response regulator CheY
MLVDDSTTIRRIQRNVLEKIGIKDIVEASDGQDALNKLSESPVDLILLDWNMPKMDGFTFLKTIRGMDKFKSVKVIMCTSESEKTKIVDAIKAGANSYVVKPFTPEILEEKLREIGIIK